MCAFLAMEGITGDTAGWPGGLAGQESYGFAVYLWVFYEPSVNLWVFDDTNTI